MTTIRLMTIEDYDAVYELWRSGGETPLNPVDDSRAGIAQYLRRNPATSFVAVRDGRVAGTIMAGHDGRRGFFHHVYVAPDCRGQGVGKRLVDSAMNALATEGIRKAALVVFADNAAGNGFWEKMGFSVREDLLYRNKFTGK